MLCCAYAGYGHPQPWASPIGSGFETFASRAQERYPGTRLSWHLYFNGGENTFDGVLARAKRSDTLDVLNGSSITEFGLWSDGNAEKLSILQTPKLVTELAQLLAFCYETGVASVYYESLMDHPTKRGEYMGLFDRWGVPKLSYSYLRLIKTVIDVSAITRCLFCRRLVASNTAKVSAGWISYQQLKLTAADHWPSEQPDVSSRVRGRCGAGDGWKYVGGGGERSGGVRWCQIAGERMGVSVPKFVTTPNYRHKSITECTKCMELWQELPY